MKPINIHETVIGWIDEIIRNNPKQVAIALRQRAKFEGWLKFELAAHAELNGAAKVMVEASIVSISGVYHGSCDIAFEWKGVCYEIELKTSNTNWRMPGVANKSCSKTKNIESIILDARKLTSIERNLLIAFVLFPIPIGDSRWHQDFKFIGHFLKETISIESHAKQITLPISPDHSADVVVCCFQASLLRQI